MNKVPAEGRDRTARLDPRNDTPPDAIYVWYNPILKRCVLVVNTAPPQTGEQQLVDERERKS